MATSAWQSSARSLLLPVTLGFVARSTKVPSVHPASDKAVIGVELPVLSDCWAVTGF